MIRILPFLLITLHFSHIGFTEDLTFMSILLSLFCRFRTGASKTEAVSPGIRRWVSPPEAHRNTASIVTQRFRGCNPYFHSYSFALFFRIRLQYFCYCRNQHLSSGYAWFKPVRSSVINRTVSKCGFKHFTSRFVGGNKIGIRCSFFPFLIPSLPL